MRAQYIQKGQSDRLLYIAASHPMLNSLTKNCSMVSTRAASGASSVYLFAACQASALERDRVRSPTSGRASIATEPLLTRGLLTPNPAYPRPRVAHRKRRAPLRRSLISQIIKQLAAGQIKSYQDAGEIRDGV